MMPSTWAERISVLLARRLFSFVPTPITSVNAVLPASGLRFLVKRIFRSPPKHQGFRARHPPLLVSSPTRNDRKSGVPTNAVLNRLLALPWAERWRDPAPRI